MKNRKIPNQRLRSNSADTGLIKKSFISKYRELCDNESFGSYGSHQINLKRFQLIRTIDNISASYTSWKDLLNQQITLHYQLYPIVENFRNQLNSNQGESPSHSKTSSLNQISEIASEISTPMTIQELNSIETAQNLIKILLKKQHDIPQFFRWQWIELFGKIYEQKQFQDLFYLNYKALKYEIIRSHTIGLNIKQDLNFTQNIRNENQYPLLLILYENSNFKENQKQTLLKKIINQIAFIRLLQVAKQKSKSISSPFEFQFNSKNCQTRKQRLQKMTLLNKRPIQFFIIISKMEQIEQLNQKFESFYLNTLKLISTQHNVTFNFLITENEWQFKNIQQIVYKNFQKNFSPKQSISENNVQNRGISDIEMSDDYQNQNQSNSMSDDYKNVLNIIGQEIIINKNYDKVPQNTFKKKQEAYINQKEDILGSNEIRDYIMNYGRQNEEKKPKEQKEEKIFTGKFLQLLMSISKQNKIFYETIGDNGDMNQINELMQKKLKSMPKEEKEKQKQEL